jgi:hypothetical protein
LKRFHIALAVRDLQASIIDYSKRLGQQPTAVVEGKYAMSALRTTQPRASQVRWM